MIYARIISTGISLPEKVMTNDDLAKIVDTSDEWISTRTGIRERRVAGPDEAASDFGAKAARKALNAAGMGPDEMDAIIVGTITPDMPFPATACLIQEKLGATKPFAFDVSAACSGYLYILSIANAFIQSGMYKHILLIGTEAMTKSVNWEDRGSCILFGDGAGATVVSPSTTPGVRFVDLGTDGRYADLIHVPAGGSRTPLSPEALAARQHCMVVNGRDVYKLAVKHAEITIKRVLAQNGLTVHDIDMLVPHQANQRITDAVADRIGIPREKVMSNIEKYGNTSAATIPICLHEAAAEGRIKKGDRLLLVAYGAGFTWGSILLDW
jgi:3-oxoacyl-[acyl-carrier-protein] synthase-3